MREGDRVYIYSDGVTETVNPEGEMFGQSQLEQVFQRGLDADELFDQIRSDLKQFQAGGEQQDDVTMVELTYNQLDLEKTISHDEDLGTHSGQAPSHWALSMELGADLMRHFDPLPLLIQSVCDIQGLHGQRQQLYTVFSELFSNSLDHGILGLDSGLKQTADGFARYYLERESRLAELTHGKIKINISLRARN